VTYKTEIDIPKMVATLSLPLEIAALVGNLSNRFKALRTITQLGIFGSVAGTEWVCPANDLSTFLGMLMERVYFVKSTPQSKSVAFSGKCQKFSQVPQPTTCYMTRLSKERNFLHHHVASVAPQSLSNLEFVSRYRGQKRRLYESAVKSLEEIPINRSDARIRAFVKQEPVAAVSGGMKPPRGIHPRSLRYNVEFGKHFCPLEKPLYEGIKKLFRDDLPVVLKGFNSHDTAAIIAEKFHRHTNPVAIGLDASRFDQHVSVPALRFEHSIYKRIVKDPHFAKLCDWQLVNAAQAWLSDGKVRYKIKGGRMSGDMNTSTGNILLMTCLLHAYLREANLLKYVSVINNGDDSVLFLSHEHLHKLENLSSWFLEFGFEMTIEPPVYRLECLEFCQQHMLYDGTEWFQVPKLKNLNKCLLGCKNFPPDELPYFAKNRAKCFLSTSGGCPIFDSVFRRLDYQVDEQRFSKLEKQGTYFHSNEYTANWYAKELECSRFDKSVTDFARVSFFSAFGITPDEQVAVEKEVGSTPNEVKLKLIGARKVEGKLLYV